MAMRFDDIIFLSYAEENAEENFDHLLDIVSHGGVGRVHGVKGILEAHKEAAKKAKTEWFYVVDGDNWICEDFKFDFNPSNYGIESTFVWRALNPVNDLCYGYGGIKFFNRDILLNRLENMKNFRVDLTTSLFKNLYPISVIASETRFNTSPFNTWKGAFRECVKLSSKIIQKQKEKETQERLEIWMTKAKGDHAEFSIKGANDGFKFGSDNKENYSELNKINNFNWLEEKFKESN